MLDEEIVALYWARDERALAETERAYGARCRGLAKRILKSAEDAEECVSDAYRRAWDSIPPERPKLLKAWLGKVVRNSSMIIYGISL